MACKMTDAESPNSLAATVLALCAASPPNRTICPTDVAKAYAEARGEGPLGWRSHLQEVRRAAVALASEGRLVIYRKGKPVDPNEFRGVYRLGAPHDD
jgi:hypothetical protein